MANELLTDKEKLNSALRHLRIAEELLEDSHARSIDRRTVFMMLQTRISPIINAITQIIPESK